MTWWDIRVISINLRRTNIWVVFVCILSSRRCISLTDTLWCRKSAIPVMGKSVNVSKSVNFFTCQINHKYNAYPLIYSLYSIITSILMLRLVQSLRSKNLSDQTLLSWCQKTLSQYGHMGPDNTPKTSCIQESSISLHLPLVSLKAKPDYFRNIFHQCFILNIVLIRYIYWFHLFIDDHIGSMSFWHQLSRVWSERFLDLSDCTKGSINIDVYDRIEWIYQRICVIIMIHLTHERNRHFRPLRHLVGIEALWQQVTK